MITIIVNIFIFMTDWIKCFFHLVRSSCRYTELMYFTFILMW